MILGHVFVVPRRVEIFPPHGRRGVYTGTKMRSPLRLWAPAIVSFSMKSLYEVCPSPAVTVVWP